MSKKVVAKLATRCELALMGKAQRVDDQSEVQTMFEYICGALDKDPKSYEGGEDVLNNRIRQYTKTNDVAYITTCTIYGMPVIVFVLKSTAEDPDERYPDPFTQSYGTPYKCAFTYCMNMVDDQMCSEFGDAFFDKKSDGFYHRVS